MTDRPTRAQVRALRQEAAEAGDHHQVECCDLALRCFSDQPWEDHDDRPACEVALAECARVIDDARAAGAA